MIDDLNVKRIKNVLCIAEMGTEIIPYHKTEVMNDGPDQRPQVTLSIGFTQLGGNLGKVIAEYKKRGGKFGDALSGYNMQAASTTSSGMFRDLLKKAGLDDPIMAEVQEELFVSLYLDPTFKWAENEGFIMPLSYLVVADSFLHSGSILGFLRSQFAEKTPRNGGREEVWICDYTKARESWLANHSMKLLRNTTYRTKYYNKLIAVGDWDLDICHMLAMNGTKPLPVALV